MGCPAGKELDREFEEENRQCARRTALTGPARRRTIAMYALMLTLLALAVMVAGLPSAHALATCRAIVQANPGAVDGFYTISCNGNGPVHVYVTSLHWHAPPHVVLALA